MWLARINQKNTVCRNNTLCTIPGNDTLTLQDDANGKPIVYMAREFIRHVCSIDALHIRQIRKTEEVNSVLTSNPH